MDKGVQVPSSSSDQKYSHSHTRKTKKRRPKRTAVQETSPTMRSESTPQPSVLSTPHDQDKPSRFPMEGGCCCGQTRYRLERAPLVTHCCHCTSCQRETGSAFAINIMIEASHVVLLGPAPPTLPASPLAPDVFPSARGGEMSTETKCLLLRTAIPQESGDPQTVSRCPACLTAVWTEYGSIGPSVLFVRGGTLDRAWRVRPDVHIFLRSKRDFVVLAEDDPTPRFEEYYDRRKVWRAESLERWHTAVLPGILKLQASQG